MSEENGLEAFRGLGLSGATLAALEKKGFSEPTEIQKACIPLLLDGQKDVIGQAQTGTGKTAAFGLPIIELLDTEDNSTQALVLTPTRELAMQVAKEIASLRGEKRISVEAIYGGTSYEGQLRALRKGVQIVVGTPGRIQDHLERGTLDLSKLKFAVLDEADEMLDMGFIEDIEKILEQTNGDKRMLFFSATMPEPILKLATRFMGDYELVRIARKEEEPSLTEQYYCALRESDKSEVLTRIIDSYTSFYGIVFCKTKVQCEEIGRLLSARGYQAEALHGDLSQKQREIILQKMREHKINILVATDVAARGIDISELTHVVNYTIPGDPEVYTHRIGRTGRAGRSGVAITFVTPSEKRKFAYIRRVNKSEIQEYRIPTVDELMLVKKDRIIASVRFQLERISDDFDDVASTLLSSADAETLVKALLKLHYGNELDPGQYHDIRLIGMQEDKRARRGEDERHTGGTTRLFFARGRKNRLTKRLLADAIIAKCGVRDSDLNDIQVMDNFSFVNVPSRLANRIITAFKDMGEDGRPLVVKAKPEEGAFRSRSHARPSNSATRRQRSWDERDQRHSRQSFYGEDDWEGYKGRKKEHGKYSRKK